MLKWFVSIFRSVVTTFRRYDKWAKSNQTYNERILVGICRANVCYHAVLDDVTKLNGSNSKYRDSSGQYAWCPLINDNNKIIVKLSQYEIDIKNSSS